MDVPGLASGSALVRVVRLVRMGLGACLGVVVPGVVPLLPPGLLE